MIKYVLQATSMLNSACVCPVAKGYLQQMKLLQQQQGGASGESCLATHGNRRILEQHTWNYQ